MTHHEDAIVQPVSSVQAESSAQGANNQEDPEELIVSNFYLSPNGTKYWVPNVAGNYRSVEGAEFASWDDVVDMYKAYAEKSDFDIRKSTTSQYKGRITHKYIVCSKAGKPRSKYVDTMQITAASIKTRSRNVKVTNCQACVKAKPVYGTEHYVLYQFIEQHIHGLVSAENMDLTRGRRQLTFSDQEFIHIMQMSSFGATISHRVQATLKGGHHLVRGTKTDYKNFSRDIRCFIGDRDVQVLEAKMKGHVKHLRNFSFEYTEASDEPRSLFWADDVSKYNYSVFGDVLAFDATYDTNMYNMIFVPFTGVDHYKKNVSHLKLGCYIMKL